MNQVSNEALPYGRPKRKRQACSRGSLVHGLFSGRAQASWCKWRHMRRHCSAALDGGRRRPHSEPRHWPSKTSKKRAVHIAPHGRGTDARAGQRSLTRPSGQSAWDPRRPGACTIRATLCKLPSQHFPSRTHPLACVRLRQTGVGLLLDPSVTGRCSCVLSLNVTVSDKPTISGGEELLVRPANWQLGGGRALRPAGFLLKCQAG